MSTSSDYSLNLVSVLMSCGTTLNYSLWEKAADNYVEAREEFNKIDTDFKDMKLYEAFGESAPQAALQISIIIQTGTLGVSTFEKVFTSIGILISFFSLTLGASDLLLKMATKDNKVKQVSWKMTVLVFPAMFFVVVPRILTISLIMAYAKSYNFIFLAAYLALSLGINYPYVRRQEQINYRTATEHKNDCQPAIDLNGAGFHLTVLSVADQLSCPSSPSGFSESCENQSLDRCKPWSLTSPIIDLFPFAGIHLKLCLEF